MSNPKVSIIIPVYNTGKYLESSVSSIQNQSLRDIEIIIIDDGSTDNSSDIIKEFADRDYRIRKFYQSNQGQSVARNLGIDNACGDYLYFMDSDDILELDTLSACYERCVSQNLDIVIFDADVFYEGGNNGKSGFNYIRAGSLEDRVYEGKEIMEELLAKDLFKAVPWLFFARRDLIEKLKLRFYPGIIHEDELFTPILYLGAERIGFIPRVFFHRRIRDNSTMTNKFSDRNLTGYFSVIESLKIFKKGCDNRDGMIIERLIKNIVISISDQSGSLSVSRRYSIIRSFAKGNLIKYTKIKNILVLLSPFSNTIKERFIKPLFATIRKVLMINFI